MFKVSYYELFIILYKSCQIWFLMLFFFCIPKILSPYIFLQKQ